MKRLDKQNSIEEIIRRSYQNSLNNINDNLLTIIEKVKIDILNKYKNDKNIVTIVKNKEEFYKLFIKVNDLDVKTITIADNEKYLRQKSKKINLKNKKLKHYINILEKYCRENDVLAMASIQLRIPKRLVYLKNTNIDLVNRFQNDTLTEEENNFNEERVLINPVIIEKIGLTNYWEACASCLENLGLVYRPYKIKVEYFDILGNKHQDVFEGFESTVLSHEMDHLDGILHMDVAKEVLQMSREERKKFRQTHGYNIINKTGSYKELIKKM